MSSWILPSIYKISKWEISLRKLTADEMQLVIFIFESTSGWVFHVNRPLLQTTIIGQASLRLHLEQYSDTYRFANWEARMETNTTIPLKRFIWKFQRDKMWFKLLKLMSDALKYPWEVTEMTAIILIYLEDFWWYDEQPVCNLQSNLKNKCQTMSNTKIHRQKDRDREREKAGKRDKLQTYLWPETERHRGRKIQTGKLERDRR